MKEQENPENNKGSHDNSNKTIEKVQKENKSSSPKNDLSPKSEQFPSKELNKRNFPSKENFFGKNSTNTKGRPISPKNQSPVLNYFGNLSPKYTQNNKYSPELHNYFDYNYSPNNIGNLNNEQNFNYSPSNIFNIGNQKKLSPDNSSNKPLVEKISNLVSDNEISSNSLPKAQMNEQNNQEEEEENEEMYYLSLDICDDKDIEEEKDNNIKELSKNLNNMNINKDSNINNNNSNKNPSNTPLNMNSDIFVPKHLENMPKTQKNVTKENEDESKNQQKEKKEEKNISPTPFLPNKFRTNINQINQINNFNDDNMLPSYVGQLNPNGLINNFTINNNFNSNFNINNNIINGNNSMLPNPNMNNGLNEMNNQFNNNMMNYTQSFQYMKEREMFPYPSKIGEFLDYKNIHPFPFFTINNNKLDNKNINNTNMNNFQFSYINNKNINTNIPFDMNNINSNSNINNNNYINNFYYNGDNYQINQFKQYNNLDNKKNGKIHTITQDDMVMTITSSNKRIKRIDPNIYLNESIEFLAHNIFSLAKDQAGCRFLQETLEKDPKKNANIFFDAILPHILNLVKDPFGNYLIQKIITHLKPEQILKILEIISPTILDIGSNNHGTRVIQHLINYLSTKKLLDYFLQSIESYIIPLLKELNGTHIIQQLLLKHPDCCKVINKIIVDNCASLASHSHGCCVLQKFLNGKDKNLKEMLINNLINSCLVLIIDQFGNYVIQSILLLKDLKYSSAIAMKIYDNVAYYSKHRYSSNVVEKCFDLCGKKEKKKLAEKLTPPEVLADLIMDEHGNYVVQKALACLDEREQQNILKNIIPLIPKIKNVAFGEKLLSKLMVSYPQFRNEVQMTNFIPQNNNSDKQNDSNNFREINFINNKSNNMFNNNENNYKKGKNKKRNNNDYMNYYNNNNNMMMKNNNMFSNNNMNYNEEERNQSNKGGQGYNKYKGNKKEKFNYKKNNNDNNNNK